MIMVLLKLGILNSKIRSYANESTANQPRFLSLKAI